MNNDAFEIVDNRLISTRNGVIVPNDEPIFILRARDSKALSVIRVYQSIFSPTTKNWKLAQKIFDDFDDFRNRFPRKIMEPNELY